jgi:hypothetical protein
MGLWKSIKKAVKGVGKFVKKNWKTIIGVAAAVAIPFAAPAIGGLLAGSAFLSSVAPGVASFLGSSLGSAAIGAGLGGIAAGATGQNPLLGAALGGLGGYAGAAGGLGNMFGGIGGGAAAPAGASFVPATGGVIDIGGATVNAATGLAAGGASAAGGLSISSLATKLATNPQAIGALGQLATVMFNKDITELTPEEEAQLKEVAAQAATNRALFEQKVMEARKVIQAGTPNPEQAYANARFQVESQMDEQMRGMPAGLQEAAGRKAAIEGAKAGTQGAAVDYVQAMNTRQVGLNMMPDEAPTGYNQLAMPTYNSLYERQNDYNEQMSKAVGGLFGALA